MAQLSGASRAFLKDKTYAWVATRGRSSGTPQLSVVWIDGDGDDILLNTAAGRAKTLNMEASPEVSVIVAEPGNPYNLLSVRGTVVEMTEDGAVEHIEALAEKYTGRPFAGFVPGMQRVIVRIRPDVILSEPEWPLAASSEG